jgi:hypothetical protein
VHEFKSIKTFYALFYPNKYFFKDFLIYEGKKTLPVVPDCMSDNCFYSYFGKLQLNKTYGRIDISVKEVTNYRIACWYCKFSGEMFRRTSEKVDAPFSFNMRNYWFSPIYYIFWCITLFQYLKLKRIKQ